MSNKKQRGIWLKTLEKHPEANFLQSPEYGRMCEALGDEAIVEDFGGLGYSLMIVRHAKRGRYLEIPCGPLIDWGDLRNKIQVFDRIREIAHEQPAFL